MAGIGDTVLDLINTNLGEEGGIPKKKKRYKSLNVVKEIGLLQELKLADLI